MEREIIWTTGDGREAKVTATLMLSKVIDADGDTVTVPCCEMRIEARIAGVFTGAGIHYVKHPVAVAKIGGLGISADNMARIDAVIAEIKATPEWQAKEAREEQNRKDGIAYDAHRAMMRKVMGY